MDGGEGRLVQALDLDAAVLGDMVLQNLEEAKLLGREARVLVHELGKRLLDCGRVEPNKAAEHGQERTAGLWVVPARCFTLALSSIWRTSFASVLEFVFAHCLACTNPLKDRILGEVVTQNGLDAALGTR